MYRFINRAFDHLNRRSPILIHTPNNRSFGNGSEEVFYGLLRAQRENKKVLFLYPRLVLFGKYRLSVDDLDMSSISGYLYRATPPEGFSGH